MNGNLALASLDVTDDFIANRSLGRVLLLVLGCAAFVVGGLWLIGAFDSPPSGGSYTKAKAYIAGWFSIAFFGFCAVLGVQMLFSDREQVRIGKAGIRSRRWSEETIPWTEITDVTTFSYNGQRTIVLHLRDPARFPGKGILGLLGGFNRWMSGGDIGISMTTTDRSFDEAMMAIEDFRPKPSTEKRGSA